VSVPVIVPRESHALTRRNIDPDALRVLYRLHQHNFAAYLVGGSVRDLLLGRRPKDFDIGTDAHPYQIKRLFRNCWIIGRRFRLAHIKFGPKTIEVATFRKIVPDPPPDGGEPDAVVVASAGPEPADPAPAGARTPAGAIDAPGMFHRDNTFGTPEEDAFRRDFTINGLFYDIASRSIIDYVGGLADLDARIIRSIGDPRVRFVEDPVRMLRAAVFAARLGFDMDPLVTEAIAEHRALILKASPARLIEELYKILRSGAAEASVRALGRVRLLELMAPDLKVPPDAIWDSLARLDRYRQQFQAAPAELSNVVLIGALLVPLGLLRRRAPDASQDGRGDRFEFGMLPVSRKDVERLRQMFQLLPRLTDPNLPPRVARSIHHRPAFSDAVTWLEIFGDAPEMVDQWKRARHHRAQAADAGQGADHARDAAHDAPPDGQPRVRRRRRRRRRRRGRGGPSGGPGES
jgi:poly(A) polymerase